MRKMAHASQSHDMHEHSLDRPRFHRLPSYSATFHTECAKSCIITDLFDLIDKVKNCVCHLTGSPCPLGPDKHHLFGRIGHLLQEDVRRCGRNGSVNPRILTRQQSIDSARCPRSNRSSLTDVSMNTSYSSESGISSLSSNDSMLSIDEESHFVVKKGYLLIINNVWFEGRFGPRSGSQAEGDRMKKLFESFGFDVEVEFNCSTFKIRGLLREKTESFYSEEYDCFALLVLSHGAEDCILGSDNKEISYEEILGMLKADKFPAMAGRPKLIFAQACRGNTFDLGCIVGRGGKDLSMDCATNDPSQSRPVRIPTDSDILIVYATTRGRVAHKSVLHAQGADAVAESWFLDALHQVLVAHADDEDLLSMLTRVNSHVAMLGNTQIGMQIPSQFSTLTRKVFLRKKMS